MGATYRFRKNSRQAERYDVCDRNPDQIAAYIDALRWAYRQAQGRERATIARLGESYQQLHVKHFGTRY